MPTEIENIWNEFKISIMHKNRYFIPNHIMSIFEKFTGIKMLPADTWITFFRAREGDHINKADEEMLAPPANKTSSGRCNPAGIPYLYLAIDKKTAAAEIRCNKDKIITIAEISVDVSNIFSFLVYLQENKFSPPIDDEKIKKLIRAINDDFSKKITSESQLEYIPLQYISEYIKHLGYDGFMYSSTVVKGMNLVMFNWYNKIKILNKEIYSAE